MDPKTTTNTSNNSTSSSNAADVNGRATDPRRNTESVPAMRADFEKVHLFMQEQCQKAKDTQKDMRETMRRLKDNKPFQIQAYHGDPFQIQAYQGNPVQAQRYETNPYQVNPFKAQGCEIKEPINLPSQSREDKDKQANITTPTTTASNNPTSGHSNTDTKFCLGGLGRTCDKVLASIKDVKQFIDDQGGQLQDISQMFDRLDARIERLMRAWNINTTHNDELRNQEYELSKTAKDLPFQTQQDEIKKAREALNKQQQKQNEQKTKQEIENVKANLTTAMHKKIEDHIDKRFLDVLISQIDDYLDEKHQDFKDELDDHLTDKLFYDLMYSIDGYLDKKIDQVMKKREDRIQTQREREQKLKFGVEENETNRKLEETAAEASSRESSATLSSGESTPFTRAFTPAGNKRKGCDGFEVDAMTGGSMKHARKEGGRSDCTQQ